MDMCCSWHDMLAADAPGSLMSVPTSAAASRAGSGDRRQRVRRTSSDPVARAQARRQAQQELEAMGAMPQVQSVNTIDEMVLPLAQHLNSCIPRSQPMRPAHDLVHGVSLGRRKTRDSLSRRIG